MSARLQSREGTDPAGPTPQAWHLITSEYPPQPGGVSDYTQLLATELAASGAEVHVWAPGCGPAEGATMLGVTVHRALGGFARADLERAGELLDRYPGPRRLLVQWVPHGFGFRSMNVFFCLWLRERARRQGDAVELMVHEPSLPFGGRSWKRNAAALVHRLMLAVVLAAARRVWVSVPAWEERLRPWAHGRRLAIRWLPVFSNVPRLEDPGAVAVIRAQLAPEGRLVGHFGTYDAPILEPVTAVLKELLVQDETVSVVLMGRGSERVREDLARSLPDFRSRVHATGGLAAPDLSLHLQACDLLVQPYPDGVTTRRGTVMAALSHAVPVVTTVGPHTEPFWAASGAVALVRSGDPSAAAGAAAALLRDEASLARLAAAAASLYGERFDVAHTVETLCRESAA